MSRAGGTQLLQAKGFAYTLEELLGDARAAERYKDGQAERYKDGQYVTLCLGSNMYHRFHAPHDCLVDEVTYISGDTWNMNPVALKRIYACTAGTSGRSCTCA